MKTEERKKVSVVVPVFNVEKYLLSCFESVASQTYQNLEIILVDDGSTDGSSKLCDKLAFVDERVRVIHQKNGGLSDARNAGLDLVTGDYVAFVDSDDTIESDMIEMLVDLLEQYDAQVSACRYTQVWEDGREERIGEDHQIKVYEGNEALKEYLYGKTMDPFVCNKLYRAELINPLTGESRRFIKGIVGEDNPFNIELFKTLDRVVLVGKSSYRYLQKRKGAITNSAISQKKIDSVFFWDGVRKDCKENYPELEIYAIRRQALFYIGLYNMIDGNKQYQEEAKTIVDFLKENNRAIQQSELCERVLKLSSRLILTAPFVYRILMKIYKRVVGQAKL